MSFFSSLHHVLDNNKYPHAHAHRSTFMEKLWATFKFFSGNVIPGALKNPAKYTEIEMNKMHFGIFDYLTLGIHFVLSFISILLVEREFLPIKLLGIILLSTLTLPRVLFAACLTIISLPFVIIAHLAASFKGDALKDTIMSHQVIEGMASKEKSGNNIKTFDKLLQDKNLDLTDIADVGLNSGESKSLITLSFFRTLKANPGKPTLELTLCLHDKNHSQMFNALKKLNIGGLQTKIEENNNQLSFYK